MFKYFPFAQAIFSRLRGASGGCAKLHQLLGAPGWFGRRSSTGRLRAAILKPKRLASHDCSHGVATDGCQFSLGLEDSPQAINGRPFGAAAGRKCSWRGDRCRYAIGAAGCKNASWTPWDRSPGARIVVAKSSALVRIPRPGAAWLDPSKPLGQAPAHPIEAMMSIQAL